MSKMTVIPFKSFHLRLMDLREWDRQLLLSNAELADLSSNYFEKNGFGYTGLGAEGIVGAAGLVRVLPGNWEAWAYTTHLFPKYGIQIHRLVKSVIVDWFANPRVNRIQCIVDSMNPVAVRWASKLGFHKEATLQKYGPGGQDFYMFAKVKLCF